MEKRLIMLSDQAQEDFYKEFWRKPGWSSPEANDDEQVRAQIIMGLIESRVKLFFKQQKSLKILDLGCGRGWLTNLLSSYGDTLGTDPCEAAIQRAKELFPDKDFRVVTSEELVAQGNAGAFDLIISSEVIEHLVDQDSFMRSIHDLLRKGGFAILTSPRGELREYWVRHHPGYDQPIEIWLTEKELNVLSKAVGFKIIRRERIFVPLRINLICKIAQSRKLIPLQQALPPVAWVFQKIRDYYSLYQIILLQRAL